MHQTSLLPPLPVVELDIVEDVSPDVSPGFLRLVRRRLVARGVDTPPSPPFIYDEVDRQAIDAVVIAAYFRDADQRTWVYLRSSARPPVGLRGRERWPTPDLARPHGLWELPAGLVEPDENREGGPRRCAQRELAEELGFHVPEHSLLPLGPSSFPCPGVIAERHYFFKVEVDPSQCHAPSLDGSAIELLGLIAAIPLEQALAHCRSGLLEDAKTELALRRLAEHLHPGS